MSSLPYALCSPLVRLPKYSGMAIATQKVLASLYAMPGPTGARQAAPRRTQRVGTRSWLRHAAWLGHQTRSTQCGWALCASLLRCAWAAQPQAIRYSHVSSELLAQAQCLPGSAHSTRAPGDPFRSGASGRAGAGPSAALDSRRCRCSACSSLIALDASSSASCSTWADRAACKPGVQDVWHTSST